MSAGIQELRLLVFNITGEEGMFDMAEQAGHINI